MKFSYRHFKKRTRKSKKASRITRRKSKTRKYKGKGGGNTFTRGVPKGAVVTNPLQWDDNAYYDLAASEELFSVE
jgi:hypothetical protein